MESNVDWLIHADGKYHDVNQSHNTAVKVKAVFRRADAYALPPWTGKSCGSCSIPRLVALAVGGPVPAFRSNTPTP